MPILSVYSKKARGSLMPLHAVPLALLLLVATAGRTHAQAEHLNFPPEHLTLARAVQEAVIHNQQLRAAGYDAQAAQADITTAGLRPNPTLTINADMGPSPGIGPLDKTYGVSVNFPFELGGKRDARLAASQAALDASKLTFQDQLRQTVGAVRTAYFDFLGTAAKARVARENLTLLDSLVALSKVRVAGNDIAVVELTRSEVERAKFAMDVVQANEEHRAALTTLLALMGRPRTDKLDGIQPDSSGFRLIEDNARADLMPLDTLIAMAERQRTDIQALRAQEKAAQTNLELQHAMSSIDLNVSLDLLRSQGVTYYGSTISVPLQFYDRNQGEIAKAEVRLEQSKVQTQAALAELRADVTNAWFDARTKQETLRTLEETVLQKASNVRTAVAYSYERGGTSLVDFLDAARTYNELEQDYVDALESYAKSLVTLNLTTGKDLFYDHE